MRQRDNHVFARLVILSRIVVCCVPGCVCGNLIFLLWWLLGLGYCCCIFFVITFCLIVFFVVIFFFIIYVSLLFLHFCCCIFCCCIFLLLHFVWLCFCSCIFILLLCSLIKVERGVITIGDAFLQHQLLSHDRPWPSHLFLTLTIFCYIFFIVVFVVVAFLLLGLLLLHFFCHYILFDCVFC